MIKEASKAVGVDLYEIFALLVADRRWEDMMNKEKKHDLKNRLNAKYDTEARKLRRKLINEK